MRISAECGEDQIVLAIDSSRNMIGIGEGAEVGLGGMVNTLTANIQSECIAMEVAGIAQVINAAQCGDRHQSAHAQSL